MVFEWFFAALILGPALMISVIAARDILTYEMHTREES